MQTSTVTNLKQPCLSCASIFLQHSHQQVSPVKCPQPTFPSLHLCSSLSLSLSLSPLQFLSLFFFFFFWIEVSVTSHIIETVRIYFHLSLQNHTRLQTEYLSYVHLFHTISPKNSLKKMARTIMP